MLADLLAGTYVEELRNYQHLGGAFGVRIYLLTSGLALSTTPYLPSIFDAGDGIGMKLPIIPTEGLFDA